MGRKIEGFYWHVHHDKLLEWCYDYNERVEYIKTEKPKHERKLRLNLFKPVRGNLPEDLVKARQEYYKAGQEYYKAGQEYYKARQEYDKAGQEYDKAGQEYVRAGQEYYKAGQECDKAWQEYINILSKYSEEA